MAFLAVFLSALRAGGPRMTCQGLVPPRSITSRDSTSSSQERPANSSRVTGSRHAGKAPRINSGFFCQYCLRN